ncbi:RHS repeat-associated core domain-containing protein [Chitinophaga silvisoli]|uniref:RHS repeat-associated core domain-containing protein n=1 Tax=Chitinophaga silvisoli TaxID=2291814 RepID=A0A3E1NZ15_9BACT|nr:RHS repeat-associated core domain-containing protein [Chitinophaga silvisoli]RFM33163.1 hypothetical protein DXN04_19220 [Chitinophaga silvisoli]
MESAAASVEESLFNNLSNTRAPLPNPYPTDNTTNPNQYCALLNASTNKVGPGLTLRVMAGDTISIATKGLYKNAGANTSSSNSSSMSAAIIQAFSGSGITDGVHSGIGTGSPISSFTSSIYSNLVTKDPNQNLSGSPKAYLNYATFDDQFNLVDENSGVKQLQGPIDSLNILSVGKFRVNRTGFIYIYLTNESAQNVYFDNLIVSHISGPLLEETHYYPFGLTMAGISSGALKGPLYPENKKKFQAQDFDDNFGLNIYQFKWRDHDPQIGRFWEVDPLADKYVYNSPYAFSENKVTSNTELEGLEVAADMRVERDLRDVSSGKITAKELNARFEARAMGDLVGVAAAGVAAFSLLQPQAAQILYASMLFGAPSPGSPTSVAATVATESAAVASEATSAAAPEASAVTTTASEAATATEATASGASGTAASNAERIQARVQAFKEAIPEGIRRDKTTTAVATGTDAAGNDVTLVGSSRGKLTKAQIGILEPGEIPVNGSSQLHAEVNVLNQAKASGITLHEIGATKPVCANCAAAIDNTGVKIVTPIKQYSPKALIKVIANPPPSNSSVQGRLFN